jgi:hypothetical protein
MSPLTNFVPRYAHAKLGDGLRGRLAHGLGHRDPTIATELDAPTLCGRQCGFRALRRRACCSRLAMPEATTKKEKAALSAAQGSERKHKKQTRSSGYPRAWICHRNRSRTYLHRAIKKPGSDRALSISDACCNRATTALALHRRRSRAYFRNQQRRRSAAPSLAAAFRSPPNPGWLPSRSGARRLSHVTKVSLEAAQLPAFLTARYWLQALPLGHRPEPLLMPLPWCDQGRSLGPSRPRP